MASHAGDAAGPSHSSSSATPGSRRDQASARGSGQKSSRHKGFGRGRGSGGRDNGRKKGDMGRSEWSKQKSDKRGANEEAQALKKQKLNNGQAADLPVYATHFDAETIAAEERRPKKKVAVMIGYSGTGYRGMQLAKDQKTIEGDLFKAFVAAGAISKANADDPKKSSFVRCARTDKGVHAAGNIISLKLIIEDEDIVKKINDALTPQIRVWGYERTSNSFSSYQLCDSRIYEYLIPTHSFLPPHHKSFLGKKSREWAERKGDMNQWQSRQEDVEGFWEKVDEERIQPILKEYPEDIREVLEKALWLNADQNASSKQVDDENEAHQKDSPANEPGVEKLTQQVTAPTESTTKPIVEEVVSTGDALANQETAANISGKRDLSTMTKEERITRRKIIEEAVKKVRAAYVTAKREYRISEFRKDRIQELLDIYVGTHNFWNFTIQKTFRDPSAKRVIKSFELNPEPILINGTEWLSMKVHGQSFMMHQIRKMVGMVALIVRSGTDSQRLAEAYSSASFSIPKAPSLGLLLERPIFDSYNKKAKAELGKEALDFTKYEAEMLDFKNKFIYEKMYEDEERDNVFGNFFNHVDNFPSNTFLFVTSGGLEATDEPDGPETGAKAADANAGAKHNGIGAELDSDDEGNEMKDNAGDEG